MLSIIPLPFMLLIEGLTSSIVPVLPLLNSPT
ncbi:hypothetical protein CETAM_01345 [Corynebacterium comes]|uniref:Uncharacterized protein n=1 Tax=Corynebacterium comes TaxID=2675218 RepID=A0A6B8VX45_9CORY|nr:hypothetical protein CETAM_01345 [Corynebacterium comes]